MRLDLSGKTLLTPQEARQLDRVANEIRSAYVGLIDRLSRQHTNSIEWWVSEIASRNTYTSSLFATRSS